MKKLLCLLLVMAMCVSLVACGGNSKQNYIGVWENANPKPSDLGLYIHQLKVYKGGTGQRVVIDINRNSEPIVSSFSWEIKDDVFNMIVSDFGDESKFGYTLEDGKLISMYDETEFKKIEE